MITATDLVEAYSRHPQREITKGLREQIKHRPREIPAELLDGLTRDQFAALEWSERFAHVRRVKRRIVFDGLVALHGPVIMSPEEHARYLAG